MDLAAVRSLRLAPVEHTYTFRDTILYGLGLGYGGRPTDPNDLAFVYERDLRTVPSMCCVIAHPGFWAKQPEFSIDWLKLLHGEQSYEIHRPLPVEGTVRGETSVDCVLDKGAGMGALLYQSKRLYDETDAHLATVRNVLFLRGDGGCGSFGEPHPPPEPIQATRSVARIEIETLPQQALIYRLSGDFNPLHADPAIAAKARFERPILHGLCSMGLATRAAVEVLVPGQPERLISMNVRFSNPAYPGETIITEFFEEAGTIRFQSRSKERDIVLLDRGFVATRS